MTEHKNVFDKSGSSSFYIKYVDKTPQFLTAKTCRLNYVTIYATYSSTFFFKHIKNMLKEECARISGNNKLFCN